MPIRSILVFLAAAMAVPCAAQAGRDLRLVPYPKQVQMRPAGLRLASGLQIRVPAGLLPRTAAGDVAAELAARGVRAGVVVVPRAGAGSWALVLAPRGASVPAPALAALPTNDEGYRLVVGPGGARVDARAEAGLLRGAATLCQLLRANVAGGVLPGVAISDYPSLRYRGFLDDITRGPSPTLATLEREARIAAYLRLNFMTYYMEQQYAFRKHPDIGPPGGSLLPSEMSAWAQSAAARGVEVIGCQQSFGHFGNILRLPAYAGLRETPDVLDPTNEGTYRLLDDMYSEEAPLLKSPFFLVCCDETYGLGTGPSKALAEKIGVGGVYARHLARLHDLLRDKYHKRMMMWGDIILQHPDHLAEIPRDTVMLSWGYDARPSFDAAIEPFTRAGYEFFVCPGTNNWSRILPDFGTATVNIANYIRDGTRHGALGALTTTWNDDGETLFAPNWYSLAWTAECAWNGSTTRKQDFDRRVGAVLLGEQDDHFGRALGLLARTHPLPGYGGMMDGRFWQADPQGPIVSVGSATRQARELLAIVDPAISELRAARKGARTNADLVDHLLFGAERMRLMATRVQTYLAIADRYSRATGGSGAAPATSLRECAADTGQVAAEYRRLRAAFSRLWLQEKRPYALAPVLARYDAAAARWDKLAEGLRDAEKAVEAGKALPTAGSLGLAIVESGVRRTAPARVLSTTLAPDAPWAAPECPRRIGLRVEAGSRPRMDLPVEVDVPIGAGDLGAPRLFQATPGGAVEVPCQVPATVAGTPPRVSFVARGTLAAGEARDYWFYVGGTGYVVPAGLGPDVKVTPAAKGMQAIDNGPLRLLVGPEGAHIYRWEVKALGGRDLTEPGDTDWAGFADITGVNRRSPNRIEVLATGPVLARLRCTDTTGLRRTYDIWAGVPWVECRFDSPSTWFACYDDIGVMGAASKTPGRYLFSNGDTGPLKPLGADTSCQDKRDGQHWCAKYVQGGPLLALLTPEATPRHMVGPGSGMGGVVVEEGPATAHFVIYGGPCPPDPAGTLNTLCGSLDYLNPPGVVVYAPQSKP